MGKRKTETDGERSGGRLKPGQWPIQLIMEGEHRELVREAVFRTGARSMAEFARLAVVAAAEAAVKKGGPR